MQEVTEEETQEVQEVVEAAIAESEGTESPFISTHLIVSSAPITAKSALGQSALIAYTLIGFIMLQSP